MRYSSPGFPEGEPDAAAGLRSADRLLERDIGQGFQAVAIFDRDDVLVYANPRFRLDWSVAATSRPSFADIIHNCRANRVGVKVDTDDIEAWLANACSKRRAQHHRSFPVDLVDGRWIWLSETCQEDGSLLLVGQDISSLKAIEAELREAHVAAQAANVAKSRFLANMSHEIRTPLNGVTTVARLLRRTGLSHRQCEMTDLIIDSGLMLERLLCDILDFTKIEEGSLPLEEQDFRLLDAIRPAIRLFQSRAEDKGLEYFVHLDESVEDKRVHGDAMRLLQIVSILLSNSVKFTSQGGVRITAHGLLEDGETTLFVTVTDSGRGISDTELGRLFQRFEQSDDSMTRQFGGSGLGLSIARALARLMGGDITCRSEVNRGSEFVLQIPFRPASEDHGVSASRDPPETPAAGKRILVAEDNAANRRIIGMVLEAVDADVAFAENGAEAVEACRVGRFDAVLMDLQMPVMDGLTAMKTLRALEQAEGAPPVPIIAISANAMTQHVEEALEAGADAHVAKPINPAQLISTLVSSLEAGAAT